VELATPDAEPFAFPEFSAWCFDGAVGADPERFPCFEISGLVWEPNVGVGADACGTVTPIGGQHGTSSMSGSVIGRCQHRIEPHSAMHQQDEPDDSAGSHQAQDGM
jgi:hypothetical protein